MAHMTQNRLAKNRSLEDVVMTMPYSAPENGAPADDAYARG